jgi:hypothetical protein
MLEPIASRRATIVIRVRHSLLRYCLTVILRTSSRLGQARADGVFVQALGLESAALGARVGAPAGALSKATLRRYAIDDWIDPLFTAP